MNLAFLAGNKLKESREIIIFLGDKYLLNMKFSLR